MPKRTPTAGTSVKLSTIPPAGLDGPPCRRHTLYGRDIESMEAHALPFGRQGEFRVDAAS
jgi:hypothetical protein